MDIAQILTEIGVELTEVERVRLAEKLAERRLEEDLQANDSRTQKSQSDEKGQTKEGQGCGDNSGGDLCARAQTDDEAEPVDVLKTPYMAALEKRSAWRWRAALEWRPQFLRALSLCPSSYVACEAAGIDHKTFTAHAGKDPIFAEACAEAEKRSRGVLLKSAWDDAVTGAEKPIYQGGKLVGTVLERSDTMRSMLLKGFIPETFDRAQQIEIKGAVAHIHVTNEQVQAALQASSPTFAALRAKQAKLLPAAVEVTPKEEGA